MEDADLSVDTTHHRHWLSKKLACFLITSSLHASSISKGPALELYCSQLHYSLETSLQMFED